MLNKGDRIGAIQSANKEVVKLYGYGTFEGEEVPPKEVNELFHNAKVDIPKLVMDNGKVVWGCQCWWGSEERVKSAVGDRKVEIVED